MDVLSSRILLRPADLARSREFYRDILGLGIYREFGSPADPATVFFLGGGLLEISGHADGPPGRCVLRDPVAEPWGLTEMWIEDPDGVRIVLVEVPADHPLRRDSRPAPPPP